MSEPVLLLTWNYVLVFYLYYPLIFTLFVIVLIIDEIHMDATRVGFTFKMTLFSPGALKGYLSLPKYFFANLSIWLSANSPAIWSMTSPLKVTIW